MLKVTESGDRLVVESRSFIVGLLCVCMLLALLVQQGLTLVSGVATTSTSIGALLGILLSGLGVYYFVEFSTFTFSKRDGLFMWRSRSVFRKQSGHLPIKRISRIRRDGQLSSEGGYESTYRLVVVTDDDQVIPLTRSFSGTQDQQLDGIVQQVRTFLGMPLT